MYLLMWVQSLFFKAEALDLVEILSRFKRHHIVSRDACNWFVHGVECRVEGEGCFSWHNLQTKKDETMYGILKY